MMKTLVTTLLTILLLTAFGIAEAQQQNRHQGPPPVPSEKQLKDRFTELSEKLELSEQQEKEINRLVEVHAATLKEKTTIEKEHRDQHRKEMESLKKEFEKSINALLTEEQQKQFAQLKKEKRPHKRERSEGQRR